MRIFIIWLWLLFVACGCSPTASRIGTPDASVDSSVRPPVPHVLGAGEYPQPQSYHLPLYVDAAVVYLAPISAHSLPPCDAGEFLGNNDGGPTHCQIPAGQQLGGINVNVTNQQYYMGTPGLSPGQPVGAVTPCLGGTTCYVGGMGAALAGASYVGEAYGGTGADLSACTTSQILQAGATTSCVTPSGDVIYSASGGFRVVKAQGGKPGEVDFLQDAGTLQWVASATTPGLSQASTSRADAATLQIVPQASTVDGGHGGNVAIVLPPRNGSGAVGEFHVTAGALGSDIFAVNEDQSSPATYTNLCLFGGGGTSSACNSNNVTIQSSAGLVFFNAPSGVPLGFGINGAYAFRAIASTSEVGVAAGYNLNVGGISGSYGSGTLGVGVVGLNTSTRPTGTLTSNHALLGADTAGTFTYSASGDTDTLGYPTTGTHNTQVQTFGLAKRCMFHTGGALADAGVHSGTCSFAVPTASVCRIDWEGIGRCNNGDGGAVGCTVGDGYLATVTGYATKNPSGTAAALGTQDFTSASQYHDTSQVADSCGVSYAGGNMTVTCKITDVNGQVDWTVSIRADCN